MEWCSGPNDESTQFSSNFAELSSDQLCIGVDPLWHRCAMAYLGIRPYQKRTRCVLGRILFEFDG
jgi:hypothetical protein